ncbi:MAG: photosynthetic reaction center cytochrome c subunit family protein [Pseudobdellovibrionaceae bacterium]
MLLRKFLKQVLILFVAIPYTHAQTASKIKEKEEQIRQQMLSISKQLGVTCIECHDTENFKKTDKKNYIISVEHLKLTQMLKDNGLDGKKGPEASCYMCHRGELKYKHQQK